MQVLSVPEHIVSRPGNHYHIEQIFQTKANYIHGNKAQYDRYPYRIQQFLRIYESVDLKSSIVYLQSSDLY